MNVDMTSSGGYSEVVRRLDLAGVEQAARGVAPGLFPAEVVPLGEGMDHRAFLVGLDYVFRFPKHRHAAEMMTIERRLLPGLSARLQVPIPHYEHVGQLADGTPFVGYRLIRGDDLTPALVASLPGPERARLVGDFAAFLDGLHAFHLEEPRALGVREFGDRPDLLEELDRARSAVFPAIGRESRSFVESRFATYLDEAANFTYEPALIHSDLWPEHVLYDRRGGKLAGIIDFNLVIGDPDLDLIYPAWAGFLEDLLALRPHPDEPGLQSYDGVVRRKVAFYEVRNVVVDACWAIEHLGASEVREQLTLLDRLARA